MLALLSIPPLLMFFQLYSVQKYFAINMELFSKDLGFSYASFLNLNNEISLPQLSVLHFPLDLKHACRNQESVATESDANLCE